VSETVVQSVLPTQIPVFPLSGVLLLPGGRLPLNIFEPRYLDMVRDAMDSHRIIGMVQPVDPLHNQLAPAIYPVGGAGQISAFEETDDGRFLITLTGVARFRIARELDVTTRYRQVIADWDRYAADRDTEQDETGIDRDRLMAALRAYLQLIELPADWHAIEKAPTGPLVDNLAMICPFGASEKQALLECGDVTERSRIVTALVEMAVLQRAGGHDQDDDDGPTIVH